MNAWVGVACRLRVRQAPAAPARDDSQARDGGRDARSGSAPYLQVPKANKAVDHDQGKQGLPDSSPLVEDGHGAARFRSQHLHEASRRAPVTSTGETSS